MHSAFSWPASRPARPRVQRPDHRLRRYRASAGRRPPEPFSFLTEQIDYQQLPCYITYTNDGVHELIRANLHRAPLYTGQIQSTGPRYCPSIEDKS